MVLSEALSTVDEAEPLPVREPFVAELAEACVNMRAKLERIINTATDEAVLAAAISQHEELNGVLARYQELLDKAEAIMPSRPSPGAAGGVPAEGTGPAPMVHVGSGAFRRTSMGMMPTIPESSTPTGSNPPGPPVPAAPSTASVAAAQGVHGGRSLIIM